MATKKEATPAARKARDRELQQAIETPAAKRKPGSPLAYVNEQMRLLAKEEETKPAAKKKAQAKK